MKAVQNGKEAVELLKTEPFDIVFMDIMMPEMGGGEATKKIREIENIKQPIIVALTANASEKDRQEYLKLGMNDVLEKPIHMAKLSYIISRKYQPTT